ncbi:MAG: hypothetical protein M1142_01185 [Patescibacteria group bacterium]|nr:hypothetical protein [Patescibacteria group bacterium]
MAIDTEASPSLGEQTETNSGDSSRTVVPLCAILGGITLAAVTQPLVDRIKENPREFIDHLTATYPVIHPFLDTIHRFLTSVNLG